MVFGKLPKTPATGTNVHGGEMEYLFKKISLISFK